MLDTDQLSGLWDTCVGDDDAMGIGASASDACLNTKRYHFMTSLANMMLCVLVPPALLVCVRAMFDLNATHLLPPMCFRLCAQIFRRHGQSTQRHPEAQL